MRRFLVWLPALWLGCASGAVLTEEEIRSQDPVVIGKAGRVMSGILDETAARARLQTAREEFLRGEYEECLSTIRRALEDGVPATIGSELSRLRFDARRKLVSRRVIRTRVRPVQDVYTVGEPLSIELRVRNVSAEKVTIPRDPSRGSRSVFEVRVSRQDWDIYGNVRSVSGRYLVPLAEDLEIPVGGERAVEFSMPEIPADERHLGFTVLRIGGVFRPAVILSGEEEYYSGVDLEGTVVRVVPRGYEPIAADPLGTLEMARRLGAREHLMLAAELSPPERRRTVIGKLVGYLDGASPAMAVTLMACLRRLTGRTFANRTGAWQAWWKKGGRDAPE